MSFRPVIGFLFLAALCTPTWAEDLETETAEVESPSETVAEDSTTTETVDTPATPVTVQSWNAPQLEIGAGTYSFNYKEDVPPPFKSTESGMMKMLGVSGSFPLNDVLVMQLLAEGSTTTTLYDGTYQNGSPIQSDTHNHVVRTQIALRRLLAQTSSGDLQGYAGLGFRLWKRDIQGAGGYLEDYHMYTLPIGVQYRHFFTDHFSVGPDLSARLLWGSVTAYLSKFPGMGDTNLPLGEAIGFRVAVPVTFWSLFADNLSLVVTPYYELIRIGTGESVALNNSGGRGTRSFAREPASDTHQFGINAAVSIGL
jgi:hypothetical protein